MIVMPTIAAVFAACLFLFSALLVVCRGFARQQEVREPYEARLWAKYSARLATEAKRAA